MNFFESEYFPYKLNQLYCEEVSVKDIVEKTGTPVYIYSKKFFTDKFSEFSNCLKMLIIKYFILLKQTLILM